MLDLKLERSANDATDAMQTSSTPHVPPQTRVRACGYPIGWRSLRDTTRVWHNARTDAGKQEFKLEVSFSFSTVWTRMTQRRPRASVRCGPDWESYALIV